MSVYAVRDLGVAIGGRALVAGLSFEIAAGECLALVGESGSGKSLSCLAPFNLVGAEVTGSALLDGAELVGRGEKALRHLRAESVGFVFQQPLSALTPHLKIGAQLREAAMQAGGSTPSRTDLADMLARVDLPDPRAMLDQYPHRLSGGQRQRVMIAAAIAHKPRLLVADEPTTALDASLRHDILGLLDRLRAELGMAMLLVSHDLHGISGHADRILVMRGGAMVETGTAQAMLSAPKSDYACALIAAAPRLDQHIPKRVPVGGVLLEARDISVSFPKPGWRRGRLQAVDHVSFAVGEGEAVALVGESGSGKSTLARAVARLGSCDSGSVLWEGAALPERRLMATPHRRLIQPVFQDPVASLDPLWRVADIVGEPLRHLGGGGDHAAAIFHALEAVELGAAFAERKPATLSGGQAQRVAIARALVAEPQLLLLDEATSALDVLVAGQIIALLQKLQRERGISILAITHDLALARALCHRIIVLDQGRAVEAGDAESLVSAPEHPVTQKLVAASR